MGMAPITDGTQESTGMLAEELTGAEYDVVKTVADNIEALKAAVSPPARKMSYGIRPRVRTTRQALVRADEIHNEIVGYAAGVTGGLGKPLYLVDNCSTDPNVEGTWAWAQLQAETNNGGMIVFVPHGQFDIPITDDQQIYEDTTVIAPGGNVTFWCTTKDGGFTMRGANSIMAYLQFRTLPGLLAGMEADGITKIEKKLVSVDPVGCDMVAFHGCEFRRASDGALDMSSSALTPDDGDCRVTVQNCIFWDTDQVMLVGGTGAGGVLGEAPLLKVTLYNNVYAYCGERQPKVARLTTVDMVDCYTILFPFQRDQIEEAVNEFSACYGASASSGGTVHARGCFWWCPPGFEVDATAGVLSAVSDSFGVEGAANATDCASEGVNTFILPENTAQVPAIPYVLAHTPVPVSGDELEVWIENRWFLAGARRDPAPEGDFIWTADETAYPNGETVLVDRTRPGRWLRVDTQPEFMTKGGWDTIPVTDDPVLDLPRGSTKTIAAGVITIDENNSYFAVITEGGAATDDLLTINGASNGRVIIIRSGSGSQTITLKTGGNIDTTRDIQITRGRGACLLYDGAIWLVVSSQVTVDTVAGLSGAITAAALKAALALDLVNNTSDANKPVSTAQATAIGLKLDASQKGAANGVAPLGADTKVSTAYLPDAVLGSVKYQGTWNANTNVPAIPAAAAGNKGYYYVVATAGATSINGITDWKLGDWIISNGTAWEKVDNTDAVISVAGKTGAVTLDKNDIGLSNVDNTSDANKPVSTAQAAAIALKANSAHTHAMADITDLPTLASASYTPALTAVANCSGLAVSRASYHRIGKRVTVSAYITGTLTTTAVITTIGIELPIARDFTVTADVQGSCRAVSNTNQAAGYINADATNDRAQATLTPTTATGAGFIIICEFSYMLP